MLVKVQKSPDLELHVGLTIQCRENENFGVVLGCVNSKDMRRKSAYGNPVLYYFSKDAKKTIPSLTPVSFFTRKSQEYEAFDVMSLYSYKVCDRDGTTRVNASNFLPFNI